MSPSASSLSDARPTILLFLLLSSGPGASGPQAPASPGSGRRPRFLRLRAGPSHPQEIVGLEGGGPLICPALPALLAEEPAGGATAAPAAAAARDPMPVFPPLIWTPYGRPTGSGSGQRGGLGGRVRQQRAGRAARPVKLLSKFPRSLPLGRNLSEPFGAPHRERCPPGAASSTSGLRGPFPSASPDVLTQLSGGHLELRTCKTGVFPHSSAPTPAQLPPEAWEPGHPACT